MPWKPIYSAQGIDLQFSGQCGGDDLLNAHAAVYSHRYAEGMHYIIADFANVEYLDLSLADLLRIAEHDRQYLLHNPPHLLVMIAPQAPVVSLMRAYEEFMQGSNLRTQIASTRAEGIAWLHSRMLEPAT
jgi:hypothetical protein